jgi:teichuronic acid biosynthesis glycosyltransferase TuaG
MNPLVSVIMPVYNAEEYVSDAIQSVINQNYENWELLIIDDGSTDNSLGVINKFKDSRIKIFSQENKGVSAARNVALEKMSGVYFCFLDADDVYTYTSLSNRLEIFLKGDDIHFVDGKVEVFNQDLSQLTSTYSPNFKGNPTEELITLSGKCFFGNTWMFKRLKNVKYKFNETLTHGEDLWFCMEHSINKSYSYTSETVLKCRKHNSSAMNNLEKLEEGYTQIVKLLDEISVSDYLKQQYLSKSKSIMFKSYLKEGKVKKAINTLLR